MTWLSTFDHIRDSYSLCDWSFGFSHEEKHDANSQGMVALATRVGAWTGRLVVDLGEWSEGLQILVSFCFNQWQWCKLLSIQTLVVKSSSILLIMIGSTPMCSNNLFYEQKYVDIINLVPAIEQLWNTKKGASFLVTFWNCCVCPCWPPKKPGFFGLLPLPPEPRDLDKGYGVDISKEYIIYIS